MEIFNKVDLTNLKQTATNEDIIELIEKANELKCASICIPPYYVSFANNYIKMKNYNLPICTVIGFPNGYSTTEVKLLETELAIKDGATEIDMVININNVKNKDFEYILNEIKSIKKVCGNLILKVIIETCLLTDEEKIELCSLVALSGADFIKTSTGFSTNGATIEDIQLLTNQMNLYNQDIDLKIEYPNRDKIKVKASGGIRTKDFANELINCGVDRIGASNIN